MVDWFVRLSDPTDPSEADDFDDDEGVGFDESWVMALYKWLIFGLSYNSIIAIGRIVFVHASKHSLLNYGKTRNNRSAFRSNRRYLSTKP